MTSVYMTGKYKYFDICVITHQYVDVRSATQITFKSK